MLDIRTQVLPINSKWLYSKDMLTMIVFFWFSQTLPEYRQIRSFTLREMKTDFWTATIFEAKREREEVCACWTTDE